MKQRPKNIIIMKQRPKNIIIIVGRDLTKWIATEAWLKALGYSWPGRGPQEPKYLEGAVLFGSATGRISYSDLLWFEREGRSQYPNYTVLDISTDVSIACVKLNDEFTARVNPTTKEVTVGCQTISFDKVLEVAAAIK